MTTGAVLRRSSMTWTPACPSHTEAASPPTGRMDTLPEGSQRVKSSRVVPRAWLPRALALGGASAAQPNGPLETVREMLCT